MTDPHQADFPFGEFPTLERLIGSGINVKEFADRHDGDYSKWCEASQIPTRVPEHLPRHRTGLDLLIGWCVDTLDEPDNLTDDEILMLSQVNSFLQHVGGEYRRWVDAAISTVIAEMRGQSGYIGERIDDLVKLVEDFGNQLKLLETPGKEGIVGQLGNVQGAWRTIEREAPAFIASRLKATFSTSAFEQLLGQVVGTGLGFIAGFMVGGGS